jgi:hypothetical protein
MNAPRLLKFILLLFLSWFTSAAYSQDRSQRLSADYCRDVFAEQVKLYPQEKLFIHTDRSSYLTGDTLWFKIYLTDAAVHLPSQLSRFAYVELINPWGGVDKRIKVKMGEGDSYSQLEIPETLPEGNYYLRAYTGTMYGLPHDYFFNKRIYISSFSFLNIKEHFYYDFDNDKITTSFYFSDSDSGEKLNIKDVAVSINGNAPKTLRMKRDNVGQLSFTIPPDAHTRTMHVQFEHDGEKFDKYLDIPTPEEVFDVKFFPEGGNLVVGSSCLIGMKAINGTGYSEQVHGFISDNNGNIVAEGVQTLHKGMGSFRITPQKDKTYYATMTNTDGHTQVFPLPPASKKAVSLSSEWENGNLKISVNRSSPSNRLNPEYLLIHSRGITHYFEEWNRKKSSLTLSKKNLPSGVLQIVLLNSDYQPLSERMVFCKNDDYAHIALETEKYDGQIGLGISLSDNNKKALTGNFSISVTNDNYTSVDKDVDIFTYMLLSSDLKGHIEDPAFYFRESEENTSQALDNLLLTQGWKRYDIPQIINGNMETSSGFVEIGQEISGTVKNTRENRTIANAQVRILSLDNMYAHETTTDENGAFLFNELDFPHNTTFLLQAYNQKGGDWVSLLVNEDEYPEMDSSDLYFYPADFTGKRDERAGIVSAYRLQEVEVVAYRPTEQDIPYFSMMADVSFNEKRIKELDAVCIHELLMRVPGVRVDGNKVIIRGASSIYGDSYACIAIDGIVMSSPEEDRDVDLDIINMPDVSRVDIFKGGGTVVWGNRCGRGTVSITTKRGNFNIFDQEEIRYNTKKIKAMGYTIPYEYYTAKYTVQETINDNLQSLDPTVFWAPDINSDKQGKASTNFYIPDRDATYTVLIQGVTDEGLLINASYKIKGNGNIVYSQSPWIQSQARNTKDS